MSKNGIVLYNGINGIDIDYIMAKVISSRVLAGPSCILLKVMGSATCSSFEVSQEMRHRHDTFIQC